MSRKPQKNYGQMRKNHTRVIHQRESLLHYPEQRFHTLRVRGVVQGHRVGVLIYGGATHNFIDSTWVAKRGIQKEKFKGFTVAVVGNSSMECNYWIPKLNVTLGNYQMTDSLYVVNV